MPGTIVPIGVNTPQHYLNIASAGVPLNSLADPGDANPPIIFEPPTLLTNGVVEVWVIATGPSVEWGGANVLISTDGTTFGQAGVLYKGGRQGILTASLASHADPDTVNTLSVNLTESFGQLLSGTTADADNHTTLCFVDGELISYQTATLTSAYHYDLTYLRRGAYGTLTPSHSVGSTFARFGPNDPSLFKYIYPANFVGTVISLKLQSFNNFGQELQDPSILPVSTYTLTGAGRVLSANIPIQFLGIPQSGLPITRYTFSAVVHIPAAMVGSGATSRIAATASTTMDIAKNGTNFAALNFAAGSATATFASAAATFTPGDVLTITPTSTDATLTDISGNIAGSL